MKNFTDKWPTATIDFYIHIFANIKTCGVMWVLVWESERILLSTTLFWKWEHVTYTMFTIFRPFVNVCTCSVWLTAMPHFFLFLFTHWKTKTLNIVLRSVQLYFFIGNLIICSQYRQNNVEKRPCLRFLKQIIDVQLLCVVLCIGWWPILPPIY